MSPPPPAPSADRPSVDVLGTRVDTFDLEGAVRRAVQLMMGPRPALLVTANALIVLDRAKDPRFEDACAKAELVVADGVGLVWAARHLHHISLPRLPGVELAIDLCEAARAINVSVFLLGAAPGVASAAADHLRAKVPGLSIAGTRDGFFSGEQDAEIVRSVRESGARLVLVAFGSPKQELWVHERRASLPPALYVGVGGSFDVWSGRLRRAPTALRRAGLEWIFRLLQEPGRWSRMARLPYFVLKVFLGRF